MTTRLTSLISSLAPWLAPIPTAYAVMVTVQSGLYWPAWVALVAAIIIETISLATTTTGLQLFAYNKNRRKSDPAAPAWMAWTLTGLVIGAQSALILALEASPVLLLFQVFSVAGTLNLALGADHDARLAQVDAEKRERSDARRQANAEKVAPISLPAYEPKRLSDGSESTATAQTLIVAAATLAACPKCGRSEFSDRFQRSGHIGKCKG